MCETCSWIDSRPHEHDVCGHCGKPINRVIGTRAWFHDGNGNGYCLAVKGEPVHPTDEWRIASPNRTDADRVNELEALLYMTRGQREALRLRYGEKHMQDGEHLDRERCPACAKGGVPFHEYTPTVWMFPLPAAAASPSPREAREDWLPEVAIFAAVMDAKIAGHDADRGKYGWRTATPERLMQWLDGYVAALRTVLRQWVFEIPAKPDVAGRVLSKAANVANLAMMIADVCGGLGNTSERAAPPPAPSPELDDASDHEGATTEVAGG